MQTTDEWPILRRGRRGRDVKALQFMLRGALNRPVLGADGVFGPETEQAVRDFQRSANVPTDGIVGRLTWTKLTDGTTTHSTVQKGDRGEYVKAAQEHLLRANYLTRDADVDGIFGPRTEDATRRFQESVNMMIDPTGVVGPATWRQLISYREVF